MCHSLRLTATAVILFVLMLVLPASLFGRFQQNLVVTLECAGSGLVLTQGDLLTRPLVILTMENISGDRIDNLLLSVSVGKENTLLYQAITKTPFTINESEIIKITNINLIENMPFPFVPVDSPPPTNLNDLINAFSATGVVPAGEYVIEATVEQSGNLVGFATCIFNAMPAIFDMELIFPGVEFGAEPPEIPTTLPFFQWEGTAEQFNFFIYEVHPGRSLEETVHSQPVYYLKNLSEKLLPYPLEADALEPGKTYAWQIQAITTGIEGDQITESAVFTFRVAEGVDPFQELLLTLPPEIMAAIQAETENCVGLPPAKLNGKEIGLEKIRDIFRRIQNGELEIYRVEY